MHNKEGHSMIAIPNDNPARHAERRAAARAYDAMRANRPLTPPPLPASAVVRRAGELELAREKRNGEYVP